ILLLQNINTTYNSAIQASTQMLSEHFFQAEQISKLQEKLEDYDKIKLLNIGLKKELQELSEQLSINISTSLDVELINTISYQKFGNFNRVWLDIKDYDPSKIYGLTYKEYVAGIVVPQDNKPLGLLNRDIKSSYAVYIGELRAPAIVKGNNSKTLVANYIPLWYDIQVGDEVLTSGLDKIFYKDLKVGKVLSISKSSGYKNATIEPYYKDIEPNYFYIIKKSH
ncbi:MAG: rod shape-determining protein MreC, partial [Sulfurimonas sp.]